jgi:hypothetical protein
MVYSVLLECRRSCSPNILVYIWRSCSPIILVYICECIYVPHICYLLAPSSVEGTAHLHARVFVFFSFLEQYVIVKLQHCIIRAFSFFSCRIRAFSFVIFLENRILYYSPFRLVEPEHTFEFSFEAGHVYICVYTNMYIYVCVYICMHVCVCIYICMYVCIYAWSISISASREAMAASPAKQK